MTEIDDELDENLHPLERVRLKNYWTYEGLRKEIRRTTGLRRDADCWRRICQEETKNPSATTKRALRLFLAVHATRANGRKRQVS